MGIGSAAKQTNMITLYFAAFFLCPFLLILCTSLTNANICPEDTEKRLEGALKTARTSAIHSNALFEFYEDLQLALFAFPIDAESHKKLLQLLIGYTKAAKGHQYCAKTRIEYLRMLIDEYEALLGDKENDASRLSQSISGYNDDDLEHSHPGRSKGPPPPREHICLRIDHCIKDTMVESESLQETMNIHYYPLESCFQLHDGIQCLERLFTSILKDKLFEMEAI